MENLQEMLKLPITLSASPKSGKWAFIADSPFAIRGTRSVPQPNGKHAILRDFSRESFLFAEIGRGYKEDHLEVTVSEHYTKAIQEFFAAEMPQQPSCIKPEMQMLDTQLQFIKFFNDRVIPNGGLIEWRKNYSGVFNASEPGTGKTLSAVAALAGVFALRVLVVCPATLTFQWQDEVNRYLVAPPTTVVVGNMVAEDRKEILRRTKDAPYLFTFVSYETFRINCEDFMSQPWDGVVFDECIKIANSDAEVTKQMLRFINPITNPNTPKIAIGLNGTPISTSAANLWTQLFATRCAGIENWEYETFRDKFTIRKKVMVSPGVFQTRFEGVENAEALAKLLGQNYFRIGKNWAILPEKLFQTVNIRMTEAEADIYEKIEASSSMIPGKSSKDLVADDQKIARLRKLREEAFAGGEVNDSAFMRYVEEGISKEDLAEIIKGFGKNSDEFAIEGEDSLEDFDEATLAALMRQAKMNRMLRLQRLTGGYEKIVEIGGSRSLVKVLDSKINWTVDYIKDNPTSSVIVFCKFNAEVHELTNRIRAAGIFVESCTGEDGPQEIEEKKKAFQSCEIRVLVCQIKKMFEGHNLQRCDKMIFFSESFQVVHREQGESRAHRLGRKEAVEYLTLLLCFPDGSQTIDHYIHENIVNRKRNALSALSVNTVKHTADEKLIALAEQLAKKFPALHGKMAEIIGAHMAAGVSETVEEETTDDFMEKDD